MAVLQSGDLSFDFRYVGFQAGWVQYQFYFRWKGEPMVRDGILKRNSVYWNARPQSAFLANEDEEDGLLPLIKRVLETNKPDYWEALEPDIIVAIYPEKFFPFLSSHKVIIYESEELKKEREARKKLKRKKGKLPDDLFTFIVFVDAYNFKGADAYYGEGLALHMVVTRHELERFANALEREYHKFKTKFGI